MLCIIDLLLGQIIMPKLHTYFPEYNRGQESFTRRQNSPEGYRNNLNVLFHFKTTVIPNITFDPELQRNRFEESFILHDELSNAKFS